ncbi:ABC transporter transmembrane domain-containing protein [Buchnera aphidicola]|uniref:ABC transporter transmembrane domain-containing protein n=1 Tax=Buchnera aphidicola TaxID=9 RepID=UPI0030EDC211
MKSSMNYWLIINRLIYHGLYYKKSLLLGVSLLLTAALAEVLSPILISNFIKNVLEKHYFSLFLIIIYIILFIFLQFSAVTLYYLQNITFNTVSIKITQKLRRKLMKSTLELPMNVFDNKSAGKISSKIINDTESVRDLYDSVFSSLVNSFVLVSTVLIAMFSLEWHMALASILLLPVVTIVIFVYKKYSVPIIKKIRHYISKTYHEFNEIINGFLVIQQFRQQKKYSNRIKKVCTSYYDEKIKSMKLEGYLLRPLLSLLSSLVLCQLIVLCTTHYVKIFQPGILYAFISYINRLNEPLISVASQQPLLQKAIVAGERIFKILDKEKQKYGNIKKNIKNSEIKIKNLNFKYKNTKKNILKNINIKIKKNSFVSFVGHTGSGKSTLVSLLMRYYEPTKGSIKIGPYKISKFSKKKFRKLISLVQQEPTILSGTILENIDLGRKFSQKKILKCINLKEFKNFIKNMKKGIYTNLGESGNNLSSGQKQLISIARALILKPKILILDEATSNIDSETEKIIQKTLLKLKKKTTLIIIAHRLSTIVNSDEIFFLENGIIAERGTHKNLMKLKSKYYKMYNAQNN